MANGNGYDDLMMFTWVCRHHGPTQVDGQTHAPEDEASQWCASLRYQKLKVTQILKLLVNNHG